MTSSQLAAETIAPGEAEAIAEIIRSIRAQIERDYPEGNRPARRDAHPKHHGAVRAELIVPKDLPDDLRVGLFARPATYRAWIRFSNGDSNAKSPDRRRDGRGMAVKVMGVSGPKLLESEPDAQTQDFLMISGPDFFVKDIAEYLELFRALDKGSPLRFFFPANPLRWRLREFRNVMKISKVISNPLKTQYWTTVPFLFGERAARFSARPVGGEVRTAVPATAHRDYLRQVMATQLASSPAEFDFQVQLQTDPAAMPIEDPRIHWDEARSPYRTIARILIPPQTFDSPAQLEFAENLSYTPWHCIAEHRPLGGTNRARKHVYEAISKLRHSMNGVPRIEPTGDETF